MAVRSSLAGILARSLLATASPPLGRPQTLPSLAHKAKRPLGGPCSLLGESRFALRHERGTVAYMDSRNREHAFSAINALVRTFEQGEARYGSGDYQEAEARKDFIDKLFIALGWDVNHDRQTNPYAQEVKVERTHGSTQRRADYAFYLAPNYRDVQFYVEAKKPHGDIATAVNCFQAIQYGYSSGTPLAVLTSFAEFLILDCRYKPNIETATSRIYKRFHYSDYSNQERFGEIYWLFSHEAVAGQSIENLALALPKPRGKAIQRGLFPGAIKAVDESLLEELDAHRSDLAHFFKRENPHLDSETLTEMTQRTLDRLVFMRFLEDKQIEPEPIVSEFGSRVPAWQDFVACSRRLDGIYNGIIFKQHAILDVNKFCMDDSGFAGICEQLCHLNSPYNFDAIPIHILGSIYERFLGKVIVATEKRVRVEEKPEVRKAGGVYYTPEYIVRYIVENTVGKLIEGKTPDEIATIRIADIACGSGSFLLGVYDLLLRYHGNWYNKLSSEQRSRCLKRGDCVERDGRLYLSLRKKREILLNNVFGVDIDAQAVEVAQLSLYLRLLQEENVGSTRDFQMEFHETLLPSLGKNIVCGNSLIGTDILDGQFFAREEERKLNPMNFKDAFPDVMKSGGFDVVVGNPPYILLQILEQKYVFDYIETNYRCAKYKIDTYHVFVERALQLTKIEGYVGYITPNTFMRNKHARELRRLILEKCEVETLRLFYYQVFKDASVDTSVILLRRKQHPRDDARIMVVSSRSQADLGDVQWGEQRRWRAHPENHFGLPGSPGSDDLEAKLRNASCSLGEFATAYFGIQTFDRTKYVAKRKIGPHFKPVIDGGNIGRYMLQPGTEYVDYRAEAIKSGGSLKVYRQQRIGVRQIGETPIATLLPAGLYTLNTIYNIYFTQPTSYDLRFVLGIISSKTLAWYWKRAFFDQKETFPKIKKDALLSIPIPRIDPSNPEDKRRHDEVTEKVDSMLESQRLLAEAQTDRDQAYYRGKCQSLDNQIDQLVYSLYGLSQEEISIIEAKSMEHSATS